MSETDQPLETYDYVEQAQDAPEYHIDHEQDEETDTEHVEYPEEQAQPITPLSQLPIMVTVRCGALNLTIEELQRLGSGTVLEVQGVTPGYASLCHGEQVVAEGELVDVGGRLGLQITRMASLS